MLRAHAFASGFPALQHTVILDAVKLTRAPLSAVCVRGQRLPRVMERAAGDGVRCHQARRPGSTDLCVDAVQALPAGSIAGVHLCSRACRPRSSASCATR